MYLSLADERLVEVYKEIVHPNGLVIAELLSRLRNKPYAEKIYAVTSVGRLFLTTASEYNDFETNFSFRIGEKKDAGKTLITFSQHPNSGGKPSAEHQGTLEEAIEYIDLYVMRILLEKHNRLS